MACQVAVRSLLVGALVVTSTTIVTALVVKLLHPPQSVRAIYAAFTFASLSPASLTFWTTVAGFLYEPSTIETDTRGTSFNPIEIALTMVVRNENIVALRGTLEALLLEFAANDEPAIDLWLLSDTDGKDAIIGEEKIVTELSRRHKNLFYRRRAKPTQRKHGNILDFARSRECQYRYLVVLDADSQLSRRSVSAMLHRIVSSGQVAVVQTIPYPIGATTLYGRWLQFAAGLYNPLWARGLAWLRQGRAPYWGHNAIVDVKCLVEQGAIPMLPGKPPLGGEILSHDAVEAARFINSGFEVHLLPEQLGSYESIPANLKESIARERRWCEGNLQNLKYLMVSKATFAAGATIIIDAIYYLKSVPQFVLALLLVLQVEKIGWRTVVFVVCLMWVVSNLIKVTCVVHRLLNASGYQEADSPWSVVASFAAELLLAFIVQPITILANIFSILGVLTGRTSGWLPQDRLASGLLLRDANRSMRAVSATAWLTCGAATLVCGGAGGLIICALASGALLAGPVVWLTSSVRAGLLARRQNLFLVEGE